MKNVLYSIDVTSNDQTVPHEMGHSLGLNHVSYKSVMTPSQQHRNRVKEVHKRDIRSMVKRALKNKSNGKTGNGSVKYVTPQEKEKRKWKLNIKKVEE